ncbi:hypothetical protein GTQ48_10675 [Alteromonas genovensis]|jgi:outer membrane biosynthesis protein TonB|uniref:TonB C-terminal domain-containing protein n=1 Tax=Alteromonas genovensis TaxID=471225 RepID=A0A6N9TFS1_9ALTE|nr:energy transducer TonB [Alteromonas genovensis]NDW15981.1 hypothetical protein [Alteromonas genovensis]
MKKTLLFTITTLLLGCSSTEPNSTETNIVKLDPIDLTKSDESVKEYWVLSEKSYPSYPIAAAKRKMNGCAKIQFIINSEGEPEDLKTINFLPDNTFVAETKKAISGHRWVPSETNKTLQPVLITQSWDYALDDVPGRLDCDSQ